MFKLIMLAALVVVATQFTGCASKGVKLHQDCQEIGRTLDGEHSIHDGCKDL